MYLNADAPPVWCLLRKEFCYDLRSHHGEFIPCCVFGVASVFGRALGLHCLTENGAQFARMPIHAFAWRKDAEPADLHELELWDALGDRVAVTAFKYLKGCRVRAFCRGKNGMRTIPGEYLFTVDWFGEPYSDDPGDGGHKNMHVLKLDTGNFAALPNNRIQWLDPALVTAPFTEKPDYVTNTRIFKAERGDLWTAENTDAYFYDSGGRNAPAKADDWPYRSVIEVGP